MISFKSKDEAQEFASLSYKLKTIQREINHIGYLLRSTTAQSKIASLTITELKNLETSSTPPISVYSSVGKMFIKRKTTKDCIEQLDTIIKSAEASIKDVEVKLLTLQKSKTSLQQETEKLAQNATVA